MSPSLPLLARSAGTAPRLPQSAERELRFPDTGSRTKMYNDAGESSPLPKSLLTVRPPGAPKFRIQQAKTTAALPSTDRGRSVHVQNHAMLGVSRPSDGSSRAAR
ncbi:hypothetical protein NDU88_005905 [Pleurodeles waltl]|uniref:Uncharacterized protein n=1 Tax=Pleurodeles waltl TaxID=8319 RepID=A0AAV7NTL0_PLEWA|nr:hypothetical protein NDU88_005905 [Pleurodeles waltl]